jgi:hypothetical protein
MGEGRNEKRVENSGGDGRKKDNKRRKRAAMKRNRRHFPDTLGLKGSKHVLWKPEPNVKF